MAIKINAALANALVNAVAGYTWAFNIYNGAQPVVAGGTAGTLLCTIAGVTFASGSNGTASLGTSFVGTSGTGATTAGQTATWARMTYGTMIIDGGVGTAGTNNFIIDNETLTEGATVTLTSGDIIVPMS